MAQARIPAPGLSPPLLLFRLLFGLLPYAVMVSGDGDLGWSCLLIVLRNVVGPCCVPGL